MYVRIVTYLKSNYFDDKLITQHEPPESTSKLLSSNFVLSFQEGAGLGAINYIDAKLITFQRLSQSSFCTEVNLEASSYRF